MHYYSFLPSSSSSSSSSSSVKLFTTLSLPTPFLLPLLTLSSPLYISPYFFSRSVSVPPPHRHRQICWPRF
ncbi:hypothetical protein BVC80_7527g2 [Macleaya cordata]|uniref:Uncharacterized protein n=1 Tax=Macleaya cordata TaxID=56857 RepID=A0A200R108_MACCD|nr:hypothetical protein BVC80_6883g3 [Macleaya cordata]OVA16361.1 hypothetical protein BVC80_8031g1 [Macleaya cordata]OVA19103.1 hypothetical protein BVC80_7527g2 [Macleaya cordata]